MQKVFAIALMLLVVGCSSFEDKKVQPKAPYTPKATGAVSDGDTLTAQEKKFFIARHKVERGKEKRWDGFRVVMDLAVEGFEPAKEYYLAIRDTKPVLPGVSNATFGAYAEVVKVILPKAAYAIRQQEGKACNSKQNFAILDTRAGAVEGEELWVFDYCEEKVTAQVKVALNNDTGRMDVTSMDGLTIE